MFKLATDMIRRAVAVFQPITIESGPALSAESLTKRIRLHLDEYALLREMGQNDPLPWQKTPSGERLKAQAQSMAVEIAALPGYRDNPLLRESHARLGRYWASGWSSGGVSEVAYRVALKTVLVYLKQLPSRPLPRLESRDAARAT